MFAHFTVESKFLLNPLCDYYQLLAATRSQSCPTALNRLILCVFEIWQWQSIYQRLKKAFVTSKMKIDAAIK